MTETSSEKPQDEIQLETGSSSRTKRRWWIPVLVICILAAGAYIYFTKAGVRSAKKGPTARSLPVVTAPAGKGDIKIYLNGLGSVTPLNTVTVKSRVDGQLMKVSFNEGQIVSSNYLLAEIDPRPFEVQLTQAEGQMARDRALLKNALVDLERYRVLFAQDSIPKQQLDTQEALVRQYEGAIKVDQGQIDGAKLQLAYCHIAAPISGRVGLRIVDPGNIVHASDANGLVVITQLQPITVIFSVPEDNLPQVMSKLGAGRRLQVEAFDRALNQKLADGSLLTVDNQIDPTTGTVRLKATFPNKNNELFPNQFVNARLLLDIKSGVTVVPQSAIQRSPQGTFVYAVGADQTAKVQPVTIGPSEGDMVSIEKGLAPGDLVVVEGADRLRDGSKVEIQGKGPANSRKGK